MDDALVEMVVESVRVHMLSSRHVVILKETGRERYLPIWIGPWEASAIAMRLQGLTPERPLTHDLFASDARGARRAGRPGRHLDARRRDVPRPAVRRRATADERRGRRPAVRRARPGGPGRCPIFAVADRSSTRRGSDARRRASASDERGSARLARGDRRAAGRPAARHLPRLRQLLDVRPAHGRGRAPARRPAAVSPRIGPPRRRARSRFTHMRRRSRQKSRDRAQDDRRLGAGRRAGGPRVVRDADLDDARPCAPQLDQQLGREERAARLDPHALERLAPEQLAGAVDVA